MSEKMLSSNKSRENRDFSNFSKQVLDAEGNKFSVKVANQNDIDEIYDLHHKVASAPENASLIHPRTQDEIANLVDGDGRTYILRETDSNVLVAKRSILLAPSAGDISQVENFPDGTMITMSDATNMEWVGRGKMKLLANAMFSALEQMDSVKNIATEITQGNNASLAQYLPHGFLVTDSVEDPSDGTFVTIQQRNFANAHPSPNENSQIEWVNPSGEFDKNANKKIRELTRENWLGVKLDRENGIGFMEFADEVVRNAMFVKVAENK